MIWIRGCATLALLAGCAAVAPLDEWGRECRETSDPARRLELVKKIIDTGEEGAIPVLIDCLEAVKRKGKKPDRVYAAATIEPNETAPPEFWALYVVTRQDFDLDIEHWRAWYEQHRGRLVWEGGARRFVPR